MPKNEKGYTLIETLMILTILFLVLGIAVQRFEPMMARARRDASIRELVTDIRYAQQMAVGERKNYNVIIDRYNGFYLIQTASHPMPQVVKRVYLQPGIAIVGTSFPEDKFYFTPLGAPSRGGTITIKDDRGKVYNITVVPATGRVKIYN